jgi:Uma2 family endonuclease
MTTSDTFAKTSQPQGRFRLPDPPEREPDDMTSFDHLSANGNTYHLKQHLVSQRPEEGDSILVSGEHYMIGQPTRNLEGNRYPDLLVAFGVDPEAYKSTNGYLISEQGKPPDFVLEIASRRTGRIDVIDKREDYAALGIGEYWRFDETGQYHGARLAGDRLVNGEYVAVDIEELPDGNRQGYSLTLNLYLRWEDGGLSFYDPATGRPIATMLDERVRADNAEARVRELEEQLSRRNP